MQQTIKLEENKIKTRQQKKRREIKTFLSSPINLAHHHSAVAPLSLRCRTNIATLLLCCCSAIAPLLHRYCFTVAPLLLHCRSTVAPLLSLLLLLHCRTAIAPVSLYCRSAAVAPAVDTQSHRYHNGVALLSNCCCSGPERV